MSKNHETAVHDGGDLRRYRAEIPNIVFLLGLTPFELALYAHLKRVAGANPGGRCFQATATIARDCGMSEGMVSKAKQGLLRADRKGLRGKALIRIEQDETGPGRARHVITIVDIWRENFRHFARQDGDEEAEESAPQPRRQSSQQSSPHELQSSQQSSPHELQSSQQSSPGEAKNQKESSKKQPSEEQTEEQQQQPPDPPPANEGGAEARAVVVASLTGLGVSEGVAEQLASVLPADTIRRQVEWLPQRLADEEAKQKPVRDAAAFLVRAIQGRYAKPVGTRRQEAEAKTRERIEQASQVTAQQRAQEKQAECERAERRRRYLEGLPGPERGALEAEAHAELVKQTFWHDYVREKGTEGPSYQQALARKVDRLADERLGCHDRETGGGE